MADLKTRLALESDEVPPEGSWGWAVSLWAFVYRWTGRGPRWMGPYQECVRCGVQAWDVDFDFDRIGPNRFVCAEDSDCEPTDPTTGGESK